METLNEELRKWRSWINRHVLVNPKAPVGGAGTGSFRAPSKGQASSPQSQIPHENSHVGKLFDWHTAFARVESALGNGGLPLNKSVEQVCIKYWPRYSSDCSGFVKAVAKDFGVNLVGQANDIVDEIQKPPWTTLHPGSGIQAKQKAEAGYLVIGGLQDKPNGHVVVVVGGPLARGKYPSAYWGSLDSTGAQKETVNFAWEEGDRDEVIYGYMAIRFDQLSDILSQARRAGAGLLP